MKHLVTGAAGFIGYHTAEKLLARGDEVVGLDNINDYYDPTLKEARLERLRRHPNFRFVKLNLEDQAAMESLFKTERFPRVIHLAAQAGVRYSLSHPHAYIQANIVGFLNILEGCRHFDVEHLTFASSSSVYGMNTRMPFSVHHNVDHPVSLYAATKKSNELMAHSYAHIYGLPVTGLRFFSVYGPWGRPDMAMFIFTKAILEGRPIEVFNNGKMQRDFTYIDDIVEGVVRTSDRIARPAPDWDSMNPDPSNSRAPYQLYNIGNNSPNQLMDVIETLEKNLGKVSEKIFLPLQPGDVPAAFAEVSDLARDCSFHPATPITIGLARFVEWYRAYYGA